MVAAAEAAAKARRGAGELRLAVDGRAEHQVAPQQVGLEVDGLRAAVAAQRTLVRSLARVGAEVARELGRT